MRLLRGLSRSRQRDQRKHQYDRPHLHLSLRVGFAIREINLRASRAFCEFFVTLACWPTSHAGVAVHAISALRAAFPALAR
jgi:hypothetical protein